MIKFTKKVFSVFLAVIFVLTGIVTTAQAATNWPATSKIQTYVITTKNNTKVYKTASSSDGSYGTIYATDLITINSYDSSSKRIYVTYPVSSGTKKGYIPLSAVTSGTWNKATGTFTATAKKQPTAVQAHQAASATSQKATNVIRLLLRAVIRR
ncbi:MAG: hypothetical protein LUG24_05310 [Clostridiales bacterium]|nr:hypothetical protein [Clostridiales bacterium]